MDNSLVTNLPVVEVEQLLETINKQENNHAGRSLLPLWCYGRRQEKA